MNQKIKNLEGEIELRGHHLSTLAQRYFLSLENMSKRIYYKKFIYKLLEEEYGSGFAPIEIKLYNRLLNSPNQMVKLVTSPDSLCNARSLNGTFLCGRRNKKCEYKEAEDSWTIRELGLKVGGKYAAGEILEKIKSYKERIEFENPSLIFLIKLIFGIWNKK